MWGYGGDKEIGATTRESRKKLEFGFLFTKRSRRAQREQKNP
jgi:hypothetical protein